MKSCEWLYCTPIIYILLYSSYTSTREYIVLGHIYIYIYIYIYMYTHTHTFFFFSVFCLFRAASAAHGGSQARGLIGATPQPQQRQIRAASSTYTTTHGNTGSLTHWRRPGIEPATSCFLVRSISTVPQWELLYILGTVVLSFLMFGNSGPKRCTVTVGPCLESN